MYTYNYTYVSLSSSLSLSLYTYIYIYVSVEVCAARSPTKRRESLRHVADSHFNVENNIPPTVVCHVIVYYGML